jgi:hypothetical protein
MSAADLIACVVYGLIFGAYYAKIRVDHSSRTSAFIDAIAWPCALGVFLAKQSRPEVPPKP